MLRNECLPERVKHTCQERARVRRTGVAHGHEEQLHICRRRPDKDTRILSVRVDIESLNQTGRGAIPPP